MKLDKHWERQKGMHCPFCGKKKMYYDNHEDKDATHYCKGCEEGIVIVGNSALRGEHEYMPED